MGDNFLPQTGVYMHTKPNTYRLPPQWEWAGFPTGPIFDQNLQVDMSSRGIFILIRLLLLLIVPVWVFTTIDIFIKSVKASAHEEYRE